MSRLAKYLVIICTIVVIGVCTYFIVSSVFLRNTRIADSEATFDIEISRLDSLLQQNVTFTSPEWKNAVRALFSEHPDMAALILYTFDTGIEYFYAEKKSKSFSTVLENEWKGQPEYDSNLTTHRIISGAFPSKPALYADMVFSVFGNIHYVPLLARITVSIMAYLAAVILIVGLVPAKSHGEPHSESAETATGSRTESSTKGGTSLYSPETGLGWNSFLVERLEYELKRAASFDQDLVLAIFNCSMFDSHTFLKAIVTLRESFTFNDLNFEYGKNGFCVIMPNMDLYQGTVRVESYLKKNRMLLSDKTRKISVGMSSRNGRLISGRRLIQESKSALARAVNEGESTIIAFKTDPKKYRSYIAGHAEPVG